MLRLMWNEKVFAYINETLINKHTQLMLQTRIENTNSRAPVRMSFLCRQGLVRSQQLALNERAKLYFGQRALLDGALLKPPTPDEQDGTEFSRSLLVGGVYGLTLHYMGKYVPPSPQDHDISMHIFMGGHAQPPVLVTPAMVTRRLSINQVEVLLDTRVSLSYGNGPCSELDRYILHKDGSVRFWQSKTTHSNAEFDIDYDTDVVSEWCDNFTRPRWEYTRFPVLPSVVYGV